MARELAQAYGAVEAGTESEIACTLQNVADSDATLWFGETTTSAARTTVGACEGLGKPCLPLYPSASFEPARVGEWIEQNQMATLNVAGNGERDEPGIGERVERFLGEVLRQIVNERG
jgi:hypothetical protein